MRLPRSAAPLALVLALAAAATPALADTVEGQQELVDRATLAAQDLLGGSAAARGELVHARAVMICPSVFRAGFLLGGEGGGCVLVARGGGNSWSSPAFYRLVGGSLGFQVGIQSAKIIMMIMTQQGLTAVMDSQFKLGADASVAAATFGGGVSANTAPAANADIIAYSDASGLYAGVSVTGASLSTDSDGDSVYYGGPTGASDIVIQMRANNPGADPLRALLMRYGSGAPRGYAPPPGYAPGSGYAPGPGYAPSPGYAPQGYSPPGGAGGAVSQQPLPPPSR